MEFWANFVNKFNTAFVEGNRWKLYLQGLGYTVELTVIALIIGIILGGMAEQNFVGSLIMSDGNFNIFYTRPLCLFFLVAAVLSLLSPVLGKLFKKA